MELTWLKKIAQQPLTQRRAMIEQSYTSLSLRRQCWLLSVSRAGLSYQPAPVDGQTRQIMRRLDEWYTEHPGLGHRRLVVLLNQEGWTINSKRVRRLRALMGLETQFPKPDLSKPGVPRQRFFSLLRGLTVYPTHQVWATDITAQAALLHSYAQRFLLCDDHLRFTQSLGATLAVEQHTRRSLVRGDFRTEFTTVG